MEKRDMFDSSGEAISYISLDQAILLARQQAREDTDWYRQRLGWEEVVWSELSSEHREDTYRVVLQFRRPGRGVREEQTGEEEFIFDLTGKLEFRQTVVWPEGAASGPPSRAVALPEEVAAPPSDTGRGRRYQAFFQDLLGALKAERLGTISTDKAGTRNWLATPSGKTGFSFVLEFASRARFRLILYIDVGLGAEKYNKAAFDSIHAGKEAIEEALGAQLSWERLDNRRASRVAWYWEKPVTIMDGPDRLDELKRWAIENYFRFRDALSPYLENLRPSFEQAGSVEIQQSHRGGLAGLWRRLRPRGSK